MTLTPATDRSNIPHTEFYASPSVIDKESDPISVIDKESEQ